MTREPAQGAMQESRPTYRSLNPAPSEIGSGSRDFSSSQIDARPGVLAMRAQAPASGPVAALFDNCFGPQGLPEQIVTSDVTETPSGGPGNIESNDQGTRRKAEGSASKVTGRPIRGQTLAKGTI